MNRSLLYLLLIIVFSLVSCASGHCRKLREGEKKEIAQPLGERVFIYKYDGSLQCGMGKAVSLATMEKELSEIKIHSKSRKSDGLVRIQQCGSPSGQANVYEISTKSLKKALDLGFKVWKF